MKCRKCGDITTIKQSIKDELPKVCEKCGGELGQKFGTPDTWLFSDPRRGAISKRFM